MTWAEVVVSVTPMSLVLMYSIGWNRGYIRARGDAEAGADA